MTIDHKLSVAKRAAALKGSAERAAALMSPAAQRELAVAASVHPKSVQAVLGGNIVHGLAGHRLRAELQRRDLMRLVPHFASAVLGSTPQAEGK